jgi:Domain of unknown function (DUF5666)
MSGTSLDEMFQPESTGAPNGRPVTEAGAGIEEDDGFDDFDLDPAHTRRVHPLTAGLLVALLGVGAFAGGVAVQKSHDSGTTAAASTGLAALAGRGGFGGGAGGGFGGAGAGATGSGAGTAASAAVIGQVVSINGTTLTVKNFGGKTIIVHLPAGTTLSKTTSEPLSSLTAGTTVTVSGTTATDGTVTATSVTTRGSG